jgi:hypothetical protein
MKKVMSKRRPVKQGPVKQQPQVVTLPPLQDVPPSPLTSPQCSEDLTTHPLFIEHLKQAWTDTQSSSDEFDKSILTYSSAGLGISLVFLKDIVPLANAVGLSLLYASWVAFGMAILVTVGSFHLSVIAFEDHIQNLTTYGLSRRPEDLNPPNRKASWLRFLKWVSGGCFVLAVAGTIVFSIWNLTEAKHMSESKGNGKPIELQGGRSPISVTPLEKGRAIGMDGRSPMTMTPLDKGRAPVAMTPLPSALPQASPQTSPIMSAPKAPVNSTKK